MSSSTNNSTQSKSPFGSSRFSSSSNSSSSSGSRSRFGSRFSRETIAWTIQPLHKTAIRLTLDGLGDPFHRLLGRPLDADASDPGAMVERLENDPALLDELTDALDTAWASYDFSGAALLYPPDSHISMAYTKPVHPLPEVEKDDDNSDETQADDDTGEAYESPYTCLRSIDMAFVMNVLARTRANVLAGDTPLALEAAFLTQTYLCDDPRITAIARATGCMKEQWE